MLSLFNQPSPVAELPLPVEMNFSPIPTNRGEIAL